MITNQELHKQNQKIIQNWFQQARTRMHFDSQLIAQQTLGSAFKVECSAKINWTIYQPELTEEGYLCFSKEFLFEDHSIPFTIVAYAWPPQHQALSLLRQKEYQQENPKFLQKNSLYATPIHSHSAFCQFFTTSDIGDLTEKRYKKVNDLIATVIQEIHYPKNYGAIDLPSNTAAYIHKLINCDPQHNIVSCHIYGVIWEKLHTIIKTVFISEEEDAKSIYNTGISRSVTIGKKSN